MYAVQDDVPLARRIDERALRNVLGCFATGVTVITARHPSGRQIGLTVNSFTSVSLDPPLVSWCISYRSWKLAALQECEQYVINILAADQEGHSRRFSTTPDPFSELACEPDAQNRLILPDACAAFVVRHYQQYPGGDHLILLAEVVDYLQYERDPLVFFGGRYRHLRTDTANAMPATPMIAEPMHHAKHSPHPIAATQHVNDEYSALVSHSPQTSLAEESTEMTRYDYFSRLAHWVSAAIIIYTLLAGFSLSLIHNPRVFGLISNLNMSLGTLLVPIMLARFAWRSFRHTPPYPSDITWGWRGIAKLHHELFYVAIFATLFSGFLMLKHGFDFFWLIAVPRLLENDTINDFFQQVHHLSVLATTLLLLSHLVAVGKHQLQGRKDILRRMWPAPRPAEH